MKIAIIGNLPGPISINGPGGSEVLTYYLIKGLIKKKVNIILFASEDSDFKKYLYRFYNSKEIEKSDNLNPNFLALKKNVYKTMLLSKIVKESTKFDLIHNSFFDTPIVFSFSNLIEKPVIHTIHNTYFQEKVFQNLANRFVPKKDVFVFVSKNQMINAKIKVRKTFVYNGVDTKLFTFNEKINNHNILWFGRAVNTKGLDLVIEVANILSKPLYLAPIVVIEKQKKYLQQILDKAKTEFKVFKNSSFKQRLNIIQNSKLFLFPIQWEEPFGLVMIEAMACGTPVVAYARGSVPEVIKDGETGFIVNSSDEDKRGDWIIKKTGIEGLCEAVERIYSMPQKQYQEMRKACRRHVEANFTVERMVDEYEKVYQEIISKRQNKY